MRKTLRIKNDGDEHHVEDHLEDNEILATMQDMTDCFKLGKTINQNNHFALALAQLQVSLVLTHEITGILNSTMKNQQMTKPE